MTNVSGEVNSADRFDPVYDAVFKCPSCDFRAHGPSALEAHLLTHEAVPIAAVGAIPIPDAGVSTSDAPIAQPDVAAELKEGVSRTYLCRDCGAELAGFATFMAHRKAHKRAEGNVLVADPEGPPQVNQPSAPGFLGKVKRFIAGEQG